MHICAYNSEYEYEMSFNISACSPNINKSEPEFGYSKWEFLFGLAWDSSSNKNPIVSQ